MASPRSISGPSAFDETETRFDRPLTLSWDEQRMRISQRDEPKKIPIPESPMNMKARMSAFEATSISSPPFVKKATQCKKAFPAPPLVDFLSSEDVSEADEISACDASTTSHTAPTSEDDSDCEEKSPEASVDLDSSSDTFMMEESAGKTLMMEESSKVGDCAMPVQAKSCEAESNKVATTSRYSYSSDSFRHLDVCQEDGSLEEPFDRPLTLSWEDQRKMISRRDFPKKFPIPASPMGMKARMGAFEVKQVLSTPTTPLARNTSIASPSPGKTNRAIPAPPLVDDSISEDTLTETAFSLASAVDETSVYDVGMSDGAPVVFVNVKGTTEYSEERKEIQQRVNCKPKHEHILAPYEEQQKALVQQRIRHSKNKVVVPKTPVKLKDRLSVFELEGKLNAPSSLNLDDDTCSLTSNHSSLSAV
jgi:hypothetical protein